MTLQRVQWPPCPTCDGTGLERKANGYASGVCMACKGSGRFLPAWRRREGAKDLTGQLKG